MTSLSSFLLAVRFNDIRTYKDCPRKLSFKVMKNVSGRGLVEKKHRMRLKRELSDVNYLLECFPKIYDHYKKPILKNRYTCSRGIPDYLLKLPDGWYIVEVKTVAPEIIVSSKLLLPYLTLFLANLKYSSIYWIMACLNFLLVPKVRLSLLFIELSKVRRRVD